MDRIKQSRLEGGKQKKKNPSDPGPDPGFFVHRCKAEIFRSIFFLLAINHGSSPLSSLRLLYYHGSTEEGSSSD